MRQHQYRQNLLLKLSTTTTSIRQCQYAKHLKWRSLWVILTQKTGEGRQNQTVGPHGLGTRNERGDALVEWCEEKELIVSNTWFKQHKRRLFTWKSPDEQTRNQIDYILVNQRFRNAVRSCKIFPGADCNSDHQGLDFMLLTYCFMLLHTFI